MSGGGGVSIGGATEIPKGGTYAAVTHDVLPIHFAAANRFMIKTGWYSLCFVDQGCSVG